MAKIEVRNLAKLTGDELVGTLRNIARAMGAEIIIEPAADILVGSEVRKMPFVALTNGTFVSEGQGIRLSTPASSTGATLDEACRQFAALLLKPSQHFKPIERLPGHIEITDPQTVGGRTRKYRVLNVA